MAAAVDDDVPLLVRVLAGNPVTGASVLSCLNTSDTRALRQLHAAVAGVVAGVPWSDTTTPVTNVEPWRAALPSAVGARLTEAAVAGLLSSDAAVEAMAGVTRLDLHKCNTVTDELLRRLPTSLRSLNVQGCTTLTTRATFAHLPALVSLDCSRTSVVTTHTSTGASGSSLPLLLQELDIRTNALTPTSLAHLTRLRVLRASRCLLSADALASLPPGLVELDAVACRRLAGTASFSHLGALQKLNVARSDFDDAALATLPPSLVHLDMSRCKHLTSAAALPPLPALRVLDVSGTHVGNAMVGSLPAALEELRMVSCRNVTAGATLDHVPTLRELYSMGTALAPTVVAACRARGCAVLAARVLRGHQHIVTSLAVLGDGRLASGDLGGEVRLWDAATGGDATAVLQAEVRLRALAALPDGRRLAAGTRSRVEVWDVTGTPPTQSATFACGSAVFALVVLTDGRLAAGCDDHSVRVVDVGAGVVAAVLEGHSDRVAALAVLPDGTLASGSDDGTVRLWDVGRAVPVPVCVAVLDGHAGVVWSLAVVADGRLAVGSWGGAVALWDVRSATCVCSVMTGGPVAALAALPDGRLVVGSEGGVIQLWDTRPAAAAVVAACSRPASTVPMTVLAHTPYDTTALLPLPDGRLACSHAADVFLLEVPPPAAYE